MSELTLYDFHAEWCGPCDQQDPIVEELEDEYPSVYFKYIDVDENTELANQFTVRSVPTIVITNEGGTVLERFSGVTGKETLSEALRSHQ